MLLRSFAVQGSWNYETLIGAGFCFTIIPALHYLYGRDGDTLRQAAGRHAELFNSHPYLATVAVGAVSRLEAEGTDPTTIQRLKSALRGSLGSLGDRLVWSGWRPMSMLIAIVLLLAGVAWWVALTAFLVVYNALHIWMRVAGLRIGLESGMGVAAKLRDAPLQKLIEAASRVASLLVGVGVVLAAGSAGVDPLTLALCSGATALGFWLGLRTRAVMIAILVALVATSLILGTLGYGA